uniref:Reverse transcriptase domain-containing protein n=1 Tax=Cannabis sativa TaxID=3483 RepID=A0A803NTC6_CANSA
MAKIRDSREEFWIELRYERLPEFRFECCTIGHPFEHCPKFLDQIYNGQEPSLPYGPEMLGSPLPSSGYDRYRTDFFKGNAWPLMTRLAKKKAFAAAIPRIIDRPNPHSYPISDLVPFHFTGFYGHPNTSQRVHTWTLLRRCFDIAPNQPRLVLGDFNEILTHEDKIGGPHRNNDQIKAFQTTIDGCHLVSVAFEGEHITWTNKCQGSGNVKERLDYGFYNDFSTDLFGKPIIQHLDFYQSDHRALKVKVSLASSHAIELSFHSRFRFEKIWLNDQDCLDIILKNWDSSSLNAIRQKMDNLKSCAHHLQAWHHNKQSNNKIRKLIGEDGSIHTSSRDILQQVESYFDEIFTSQGLDQHVLDFVLDTIPVTISSESRSVLSLPFTTDEVQSAVRSMSEDNSLGIDGMSIMFYSNYWNIVGPLVTTAVLEVLNNGDDPSSFNKTLITLIPKVKKPSKITQFRPISLCNVLYKLVSKTIVLRIQPYMAMVISEFQSAFLSQRLIQDNILVAVEVLHSLKTRKRGQQGYAAMKLDMSKAFDRVEWHFIEQVMLKMGFGSTLVELILRCICSVSYSFLLNGFIQGSVAPQRGIRQGDPLSPYLFLICSEGFSRLLQFEEATGALHGLKVSRSAPSISHLLFVDDCVLFCRASWSTA